MSGNDDVTVVIPCFDYGEFLGEAVESALAQDGRAAARGGGGRRLDRRRETLRAFERAAGRGRAAAPARTRGVSAARNAGRGRRRTPLLLMLDADDRLRPGALAALRAPLEADPALGFAYGDASSSAPGRAGSTFPDYDPYRLLYRSIVTATEPDAARGVRGARRLRRRAAGLRGLGPLPAARSSRAGAGGACPSSCSTTAATRARACPGDRRDYRRRYRAIRREARRRSTRAPASSRPRQRARAGRPARLPDLVGLAPASRRGRAGALPGAVPLPPRGRGASSTSSA